MAYNNFSSASVDIWDHSGDPRQSLADDVFATTSVSNIEMADDYEPVAYQATRALLAANAVNELQELQQQNHATTAYSTLNCTAKPLFPLFDAQRKQICAEDEERARWVSKDGAGFSGPAGAGCGVSAGLGVASTSNANIRTNVNTASLSSEVDAAGDTGFTTQRAPIKPKNKFVNSIRGALYDLKHWRELPLDTATDTWKFIATRDDRAGYLLLLLTLILFCIAVLVMAISSMRQAKKQRRQMMKIITAIKNQQHVAVMQQRYAAQPPVNGGYSYNKNTRQAQTRH